MPEIVCSRSQGPWVQGLIVFAYGDFSFTYGATSPEVMKETKDRLSRMIPQNTPAGMMWNSQLKAFTCHRDYEEVLKKIFPNFEAAKDRYLAKKEQKRLQCTLF